MQENALSHVPTGVLLKQDCLMVCTIQSHSSEMEGYTDLISKIKKKEESEIGGVKNHARYKYFCSSHT